MKTKKKKKNSRKKMAAIRISQREFIVRSRSIAAHAEKSYDHINKREN